MRAALYDFAALCLTRFEIIFRGHHGWTRRRVVRIKAFVDDGAHPACVAHAHNVDAFGIGAGEHPVLVLQLAHDALHRAARAKRLVASDAGVGLFFLQHFVACGPCVKIETRLDADYFFRACRLAKAALHAQAFREAQHRHVGIVAQSPCGTGVNASVAKGAALNVERNAAKRRAFVEWDYADGIWRCMMQFAERGLQHAALGAARDEACGLGCGYALRGSAKLLQQ